MSFRDDQNNARSSRHDIKDHGSTSGTGWGLAIVLLVMLAILGLGILTSP